MTVVKINAITVPRERFNEFSELVASRAGKVEESEGFEGFELWSFDVLERIDRELGPHDRQLMRRQRLPDADQGSVRLGRNSGLSEIGVRGAEGEAMHAW
jgi:hypothetical protein